MQGIALKNKVCLLDLQSLSQPEPASPSPETLLRVNTLTRPSLTALPPNAALRGSSAAGVGMRSKLAETCALCAVVAIFGKCGGVSAVVAIFGECGGMRVVEAIFSKRGRVSAVITIRGKGGRPGAAVAVFSKARRMGAVITVCCKRIQSQYRERWRGSFGFSWSCSLLRVGDVVSRWVQITPIK